MGRAKHCTAEERKIILKLRAEGKSYKFIQNTVGCSAKMITNATKRQNRDENRGRKKKTSIQTDRRIVRAVRENPFVTSSQLVVDLHLDISSSTVRRRLIAENLRSRRPRRVPLLTTKHVKNRLSFANEHLLWPVTRWRCVLWSDETKVVLYNNFCDKQFVRRPPGTALLPRYTKPTIKHGLLSIMVWGCFSWRGVGPIFKIDGIMTQDVYLNILRNVMLPYADEEMPIRWIYQQDNDPKHTARRVKQWFVENKVCLMTWPAQSPDLNPIENLWAEVKKDVAAAKPKNRNELWQAVQRSWTSISAEKCERLVDSMERRLHAVLASKGHATKY